MFDWKYVKTWFLTTANYSGLVYRPTNEWYFYQWIATICCWPPAKDRLWDNETQACERSLIPQAGSSWSFCKSLLLLVVILLPFASVSRVCVVVVHLFAFLWDNFALFCGHFAPACGCFVSLCSHFASLDSCFVPLIVHSSLCGCYTSLDSCFESPPHFFVVPLHLLVVKLCPFVFFFLLSLYAGFASVCGCNASFYGCSASLRCLVVTLHLFVVVSVLYLVILHHLWPLRGRFRFLRECLIDKNNECVSSLSPSGLFSNL